MVAQVFQGPCQGSVKSFGKSFERKLCDVGVSENRGP